LRGGFLVAAVAIGALGSVSLGCGAEEPTSDSVPASKTASAGAGAESTDAADPPVGSPNAQPELEAMLREDAMAPRHASDGGGRAWLDPVDGAPPVARAGQPGRFPLAYEAGPEGIAEGGTLFLQIPPYWGWSTPQVEAPDALGFTRVSTEVEGLELRAATVAEGLLAVELVGRGLQEGGRIALDYGAGPAGARADRFAERGSRFYFAVDGDGDGVRAWIDAFPEVDVAAGPPAQLVAFLPSTARPGEPVRLRLAVLDAQGSTGVAAEGAFEIEASEAIQVAASVPVGSDGRGSTELRADEPGVVRLTVRGPGGLEAETNPMLVSADANRILWADLHGHSRNSDGTGTADDYYVYAREVAALDVAALTDHDHWGIPFLDEEPEVWEHLQDVAARHHEPGAFVTLVGYEWTSWVYGHRHVLHFGERAALRSSLDEATDTPDELWAALRGEDALTFAHHSAGLPVATDWSFTPDPVLEPITEIASVHGSSESRDTPEPVRGGIDGNFVRDVLGRGVRLGFVGSGDSHDGHPGLVQLASGTGGLAAILDAEPTREGILGALRTRRSYATNGPRIVLGTRLDGERMGSVLPAGVERRLEVRVVAPSELAAVELVTADGVVTRTPVDGRAAAGSYEVPPLPPGSFLYVRVLQEDGGAAWSSPYFFEAEE
jgi:hypothetical protein